MIFLVRLKYRLYDLEFNIRMFLQKIFRKDHVSDCEAWNADSYIAAYAYPRIKRLRYVTQSHPPDLIASEWDSVLNEILFGLELNFADLKYNHKRMKKFHRQFGVDYDRMNKDDMDKMNELQERGRKGLELFGKYFTSLWD